MIEIRDQSGEVVELRVTAQDFVDAGVLSPGGIILPGHPAYAPTLSQSLPPGWQSQTKGLFVARSGGGNLLDVASEADLTDYLYGGEYEQRQSELNDNFLT